MAKLVITVVDGGLYIKESRSVRIWDEVGGEKATEEDLEALARGGSLAG